MYFKGIRFQKAAAALLCAGLAAATAGCSVQKQEETSRTELLVAAAASLENVFEEELIPMFEAGHPGIQVKGTYDSSGKLQRQIEEGLEADVFMSAARTQMDALSEEGLMEEDSVTDLLENQIVLITSSENEQNLASFTDIVKADPVAIGDPDSVPAGQYAREALTDLGLWDQVLSKASLGTNVTEVLSWVAEGSAQAGIVYATDAASTDKVKVIAAAPEGSLSEPALYPAGIVAASTHQKEAEQFLSFLKDDEAKGVFEHYGFTIHETE